MALPQRKLQVGFHTVAQCCTPNEWGKKAVHIDDNVAVFIHILLQTNEILATINMDQSAGFDHEIISTFNNFDLLQILFFL